MGKDINTFGAFDPVWWDHESPVYLAFGGVDVSAKRREQFLDDATDDSLSDTVDGVDEAFGWVSDRGTGETFRDLYRWRIGDEPAIVDEELRLYQDLQELDREPLTRVNITAEEQQTAGRGPQTRIVYAAEAHQEDAMIPLSAEWGILLGMNDGAQIRAEHDDYIADTDFAAGNHDFSAVPPSDRRFGLMPGATEEPVDGPHYLPRASAAHDGLDASRYEAAREVRVLPVEQARTVIDQFIDMYAEEYATEDDTVGGVRDRAAQYAENFRAINTGNRSYLVHNDHIWPRSRRTFKAENGLDDDIPPEHTDAVDRYTIPNTLKTLLSVRDEGYEFFLETVPPRTEHRLLDDHPEYSNVTEAVPVSFAVQRDDDSVDEPVYELDGRYCSVFLPGDAPTHIYHHDDRDGDLVYDGRAPRGPEVAEEVQDAPDDRMFM